MDIRFFGNACLRIDTAHIKILCDPWFTPGAYDGSWYPYPRIEDPLDEIGDVDIIYISHIHPDHYDPDFILSYLEYYGKKRIICPALAPNHLIKKAAADGITIEEADRIDFEDCVLQIFPADTGNHSDIDSAIVVAENGSAVVNLNDCGWCDSQFKRIQVFLADNHLTLDLLAIAYTAAGPYPQTYYEPSNELRDIANVHSRHYIDQYLETKRFFKPKRAMPFASGYLLGGRNAELNQYRAVIDATEMRNYDPDCVILKIGQGIYRTDTGEVLGERVEPYCENEAKREIEKISKEKLSFETQLAMSIKDIKWYPLINAAFTRAKQRSSVTGDYIFVIHILDLGHCSKVIEVNANKDTGKFSFVAKGNENEMDSNCTFLYIDFRLFYGLLTGLYHWNNAEVGSLYRSRRSGDFNIQAQNFLNFFSII